MPTTGIVRPRGDMLRPWAMADWPYPSIVHAMKIFEIILGWGLLSIVVWRLADYGLTWRKLDYWLIFILIFIAVKVMQAVAA